MKPKIYFFYPNIINDGIKRTFEVYFNYFKKNYNIVLITNSDHKLIKNYSKIQIIKPKLNFFNKFKILNNILCVCKIFFLKENKIKIFSLDDHFLLLLLKFVGMNFKLILRTPNPIFNIYNKDEQKFRNYKGFTNTFEIYFYRYADLVITYSKQNKLSLIKKFKVKNAHHINNFFEKKFVKKNKIKKIYNVFFIGRLVESKDPIFFLSNMLKLQKKINIKIYILGNGLLINSLKQVSKNSKNVKFLNYIDKPFEKYYSLIDLFCVTSKFDGTPNVLGEALAYSIPCVAPKNVGLSNYMLKNGKGGYLYKQGNDKSFQDNVAYALKYYQKTIRKSYISFKHLENFSKKNTLTKLEKLLSKI